jgi:ADP-ribose pyrophosphatase YjhB (NUDIX family)
MVKFCTQCGTAVEERMAFGKMRAVCPACGTVNFEDPKVAVGVVVSYLGGIVLGKRNHEPKMGSWSFPSGFVEVGEPLELAAARECEEETGLKVRIDHLLGAYSTPGERVIFIAYAGTAIGGTMAPGDECTDVQIFHADAMPDMAFPHDGAILEAWQRGTPLPITAPTEAS